MGRVSGIGSIGGLAGLMFLSLLLELVRLKMLQSCFMINFQNKIILIFNRNLSRSSTRSMFHHSAEQVKLQMLYYPS